MLTCSAVPCPDERMHGRRVRDQAALSVGELLLERFADGAVFQR